MILRIHVSKTYGMCPMVERDMPAATVVKPRRSMFLQLRYPCSNGVAKRSAEIFEQGQNRYPPFIVGSRIRQWPATQKKLSHLVVTTYCGFDVQ